MRRTAAGEPRTTARRLLLLTPAYALLAFLLTLAVVWRLDARVVMHATATPTPSATDAPTATPSPAPTDVPYRYRITGLLRAATEFTFTSDGRYMNCREGGDYVVREVATGAVVHRIDDAGVLRASLMADRNIVLYFVRAGSTLQIKTYDIDLDRTTLRRTLALPTGTALESFDFSTATNLIVLQLRRTSGAAATDTIDSMNVVRVVKVFYAGAPAGGMTLLNDSFTVYTVRAGDALHNGDVAVAGLPRVAVVGCDAGDLLYVRSLEAPGTVYVVKGSQVLASYAVDATGLVGFHSNKAAVYAVYPDHLAALSATGVSAPLAIHDPSWEFIDVAGDLAFYRDPNGDVLAAAIALPNAS